MIELMPSTEEEEVLQNVRMISGIWVGSVPLERDLGIDAGILDLPIAQAKARLTAELAEAISKYEPRARLKGISYEAEEGRLNPKLELEVMI